MADRMIERIGEAAMAASADADGQGLGLAQKQAHVARAILTAIRAPSPTMAKAAAGVVVGCCQTNASDAMEIWEYMIDAALAEMPA